MSEFEYYLNGWLILAPIALLVIIITFVAMLISELSSKPKPKKPMTIKDMIDKLNNPDLSKEVYNEIATIFLDKFSKLPSKQEIKQHPELKSKFDEVLELMRHFADHRETDEGTIIELQKKMIELNPEHKEEITQNINKSLKKKK